MIFDLSRILPSCRTLAEQQSKRFNGLRCPAGSRPRTYRAFNSPLGRAKEYCSVIAREYSPPVNGYPFGFDARGVFSFFLLYLYGPRRARYLRVRNVRYVRYGLFVTRAKQT